MGSLFWGLLTLTCIVWYTFVTLYVAVRGAKDIRDMLGRLKEEAEKNP